MKIKTIRQIRKCLNGNLAAYLAPLANPLSSNVAVGNGINRQTQGTNPRNKYKYQFKLDLSEQKSTFFSDLHQQQVFWWNAVMSFFLHFDNLQTKWLKSFPINENFKNYSYYINYVGGTSFPAFDPTSKVDLVFLCCFPCLFLIFSIVYVIAFYFWVKNTWMYKVNK